MGGASVKIAEYKQIDTKIEEYTVVIPPEYDEEGNVIIEEHNEIRAREVPVMGVVDRDRTPEEEAEYQSMPDIPQEPTQEDRIEAQVLYTALMTDTLLEG